MNELRGEERDRAWLANSDFADFQMQYAACVLH